MRQLLKKRGGNHIVDFMGCPEATWIDDDSLLLELLSEGEVQGSGSNAPALMVISVGCNKGHDVLRMTRLLPKDPI